MNNFYHLIILDASGSMSCIREAALSGCNETIQTIRSLQMDDDNRHYLSLVSFNSSDKTHYIYDSCPIVEANDLAESSYVPNGCTPLYDCVGLTICHLQNLIKYVESPNVLVTIITDGLENNSTSFDAKKVKSLVEECKQQGWMFAYIGANQDEVLEASKMGIHNTMSFEQNDEDTTVMFSITNECIRHYCASAPTLSFEERNTKFFKPRKPKK